MVQTRERDIRNAMYALLAATGEFDYLPIGLLPDEYAPGSAGTKSISIEPLSGRHLMKWDEGGEVGQEQDIKVKVTITASDDDPQIRDELAEQLYNVAMNALNGQALPAGGDITTLPDFTAFDSYKWIKPAHPNRQIEAIFSFRYILPDDETFNTSE